MRNGIHVRRFVHPESVKPLRFRHRAEKKFAKLSIERVVADHYLHATIVHHKDYPGSMRALAHTMQTQPDTGDSLQHVEALDAGAFGYSPITKSTWFAIALEGAALEGEYNHYGTALGMPQRGDFVPHVTLFKVNDAVLPDTADEVGEWIRENSPEEITLKPISVAWSVKD